MSRYRGYRSSRGHGWEHARAHIEARHELTREFGGIDRDIEAIFLRLEADRLNRMLREYGRKFGQKAEAYARETHIKWKSGSVKMSGQTALRLLNLIPPYLPDADRYALFKKLRQHHITRSRIAIKAEIESWEAKVRPAVESLVERARYHNLPEPILRKAKWLATDDLVAFNTLLARVEEEDARLRTQLLNQEFDRIRVLLDAAPNAKKVAHTIQLPYGDISVEIVRPRRGWLSPLSTPRTIGPSMENKDKSLVPLNQSETSITRPADNLFDDALSNLSPEEAAKLRARVLDEKVRLDATAKEAEQRFVNSSRDMANTLRLTDEMDRRIRSDYEVRSRFETSSGTTDVHVKRNNNMMGVIVAVAIAIVILFLLAN